ncbi:Hypothetical predicted protein, partial [Pelobates cultripes]
EQAPLLPAGPAQAHRGNNTADTSNFCRHDNFFGADRSGPSGGWGSLWGLL